MQTSRLALLATFGSSTIAGFAQAETDAWQLLEQIEIEEIVTETTYEVKKKFPAAMDEAANGIEISGYAIPMYPGETITDLMLISDMGLCPLCGNGGHGANLQITLAEPITFIDETQRITLRGNLQKVTDPETWQSAILKDAQIVFQ